MDRIACAFIPRFELAYRARADPTLWQRPVAVVELASRPPKLAALTPAAEARGLHTGQLASQARALCPELTVLPPDAERHAAAEQALLQLLSRHAPQLDCDHRGAFFLGLSGMEQLIPSERAYAETVRAALASAGYPSRVAIADHPFLAWVASQHGAPVECVPSGAGDGVLARVPLSSLNIAESGQTLLKLLGLTTAGQLASLPPGALAQRLGPEGFTLERLCRGEALFARPSSHKLPLEAERAELELDPPVEDLEPLLFLAKSLVHRLLVAVGQSRQALVELTCLARLDDKSTVERVLTPAEATLEDRGLVDLFRLWLETKPFAAPVAALTFIATRTGAASARQLDLFERKAQAEARALERAVARLRSAFGASAVVRPALLDTHRPEARVAWEPFDPAPRAPPAGWKPCGVLKRLPTPERVEWSPGQRLQRAGRPSLAVVASDGPHRLSGEWWSAPFDRSYWWLSASDGGLYWVYRDEAQGTFHLQAWVD